jgi:hypothetical protein
MDYSLDGDGFLTLLLGGHAGSNYRNLVMIDSGFKNTAELPIREDVLSLSAAGRYVALRLLTGWISTPEIFLLTPV